MNSSQPSDQATPENFQIAKDRWQDTVDYDRDNREKAMNDLRFANGDQWPSDVLEERTAARRPVLVMNQLAKFISQVVNDQRKNRPAIKVYAVDDAGDPKKAETYNGIIKNVENQSRADIAYDTGIKNTATCGRGAIRLNTRYVGDDSFDQELVIKPVQNPFACYFDPMMDPFNPEDTCEFAFYKDTMFISDYEDMFPGKAVSDIPANEGNYYYNDDKGKTTTILEYYYRVKDKYTIYQLDDVDGTVVRELPIDPETGKAVKPRMKRQVTAKKVYWMKLSGGDILEGPTEIPSKYITLIPIWGEYNNLDGVYDFRGIVRFAKDAQRMYNYWRTTAAEMLALAPKAPYIATKAMTKGYEQQWHDANTEQRSVLYYNVDPKNPQLKPTREAPPQVGEGITKESAIAAQEIKDTIGMYGDNLGQKTNATSGRAILARQKEGDNSVFGYIDNLARAMTHLGRVMVDMIPRVYDSTRVVRIVGEDGKDSVITLNEPVMETPDGQTEAIESIMNDMSVGKMDVVVSVGPGYNTLRLEAAEAMMTIINANPDMMTVFGDLWLENFDWKNSDVMAARVKALIPPEIRNAKPGQEDEQQQGPTPEQQAAIQAQQMEMQTKQSEDQAKVSVAELKVKQEETKLAQEQVQLKINEIELDTKEVELRLKTGELMPANQEAVPA